MLSTIKFWEVLGTYDMSFCSKRYAVSVVLTMRDGRNTHY